MGKYKLMIVDDEKDIVDMLGLILKKSGYDPQLFTSPVSAMEEFKRSPESYDLVISDLTMPEMSGKELTKKLNKVRQDLPQIMLSGNINFGKNNPSYIKSIILKPVTIDELLTAVRKILPDRI